MWLTLALGSLLTLLLVWELYICEGTHLGRRFVVWLYGLTACQYNRIKQFDRDWEIRYLGEPVAQVLGTLPDPAVLDVGAGTGRLAWALEASARFRGTLVAVEPAAEMSRFQLSTGPRVRTQWLRAWAGRLPFADAGFDLVASLEVLEFTPDPESTLRELVRMLRPGGWLLVTNRIGWQSALFLGRRIPRRQFEATLQAQGLADVEVFPWQVDYDLAWARKPVWA